MAREAFSEANTSSSSSIGSCALPAGADGGSEYSASTWRIASSSDLRCRSTTAADGGGLIAESFAVTVARALS